MPDSLWSLSVLPLLALLSGCPSERLEEGPGPDPAVVHLRVTKLPAGTAPLNLGFEVEFEVPASLIIWDFGDGSTGAGKYLFHTYRRPGVYTLKVTGFFEGAAVGELVKADFIHVFRELNASERAVVEASNDFGFDLFRNVRDPSRRENVLVSPFSVAVALAMLANGASGSTKESLRTVLGIDALPEPESNGAFAYLLRFLQGSDPTTILRIANSIWIAPGVAPSPSLAEAWRESFEAELLTPIEADRVNAWVFEKTDGAIDSVVDEVPPQWEMLLVNALCFNGSWASPFDPSATKDAVFHLENGGESPCRMMAQSGRFHYLDDPAFEAVELPYGAGGFRMTVLLPKQGYDPEALVSGLSCASWNCLRAGAVSQEGEIELPRFSFGYEKRLKDVLASMGMGQVFDPGAADFSGLGSSAGGLCLDEAEHKTFIDVNEEGTRAAAVTTLARCSPPPPFSFRADRPFLIVLWEGASGQILFLGKILEPAGE